MNEGKAMAADHDIVGVCPNCDQWQRRSNGGDCTHECIARGFAPRAMPKYSESTDKPCPRTLALYKPGVPMPGVSHHYAWTGRIPCTGVLRCTLCGDRKN